LKKLFMTTKRTKITKGLNKGEFTELKKRANMTIKCIASTHFVVHELSGLPDNTSGELPGVCSLTIFMKSITFDNSK
ncbi:MAG: hypothetical protein ACE5IY_21310, partial [bacterium]